MDNDRGGCLSRSLAPPPPTGLSRPLFNWIQCYADYYGIDYENFLSGIRLAAQTLLPLPGLRDAIREASSQPMETEGADLCPEGLIMWYSVFSRGVSSMKMWRRERRGGITFSLLWDPLGYLRQVTIQNGVFWEKLITFLINRAQRTIHPSRFNRNSFNWQLTSRNSEAKGIEDHSFNKWTWGIWLKASLYRCARAYILTLIVSQKPLSSETISSVRGWCSIGLIKLRNARSNSRSYLAPTRLKGHRTETRRWIHRHSGRAKASLILISVVASRSFGYTWRSGGGEDDDEALPADSCRRYFFPLSSSERVRFA